ncbi:beta-glucuronidase [Bifidobacterium sp. CP2]|uniref:beta-glucuronidase n=1 Tax=Bifidobacterium sp. CP2 TaxID=2809025 RepID=UPI001BDC6171|nr:beta-glucuronidase [Bifidobacterium sp. CP2]MBT1181915.1 beta-glucuronidase [Bifidobacterium sp. CP2]
MTDGALLYPRVTATRRIQDMDGMWGFRFDPAGEGERNGWPKDGLPDPRPMPVPASFNDIVTDKASREYAGDFWYETDVLVPGEWRDKDLYLRFDAATHRADVFVNGTHVGSHEGGFTPFAVRIDDVVRWNGRNHVAVRVNNELSHTSLPAGTTGTLPDGTPINGPYFDFFNYAGLQRPVRLIAVPKEAVTGYATTYDIHDDGSADVRYDVETNGTHAVEARLYDADGVMVAQASGGQGVLHMTDAHLWNVRAAYLYRIEFTIVDDATSDEARIIDRYDDEIGIRTVQVEGRRILVNGKPVHLKGFRRHEDSIVNGRGENLAVIARDYALMEWTGANSFRTSHYPYSEEDLRMADREGFLVIDECAAVGFMASLMNFIDAANDSNPHRGRGFFDDPDVQERTLAVHKAALRELFERDRNHPSVIMWSLMNEPDSAAESAVPYFEEIFATARTLDPQHRPLTYTNLMMAAAGKDRCHRFADVICLNRYYGWYVQGEYQLAGAEKAFIDEMDRWMELEPDKPFVFTEYGADTEAGVHKLPSVQWSEEYQCEYLEMQHRVFDRYDAVVGEQVWNLCDFQTGEGIMRVDGNRKGVFTRDRQPKAAAFLLKRRWETM